MTAVPIDLQDFGPEAPDAPSAEAPRQNPLDSYEEGYRAGWDDAIAHQKDENARIGDDLHARLQEIRFTYAEARAAALASVRPLIDDIVAGLLPTLAAEAVGPTIVAEVATLTDGAAGEVCRIRVAPDRADAVRELAEAHFSDGVEVLAEPAFAGNQARIDFGEERREIDIDAAAARIRDAIAGVFDQTDPPKEAAHG